MPADATTIKQMIDDDLESSGNRLIKATGLRAVLKAMMDWVASVAGLEGPEGPVGPTGHIDQAKLKGIWSEGETYYNGDMLIHYSGEVDRQNEDYDEVIGGLFICKVASSTDHPPVTGTASYHADWQLISWLRLPVTGQSEHTVIVTSEVTYITKGCREIIIPTSVIIAGAKFIIKMGPEVGIGLSHTTAPKELTVHNGNAKGFKFESTGGSVAWSDCYFLSDPARNIAMSVKVAMDFTGKGIYDFIKKFPDLPGYDGDYIVRLRPETSLLAYDKVNVRTSVTSIQLYRETRNVVVFNGFGPVDYKLVLPKVNGICVYDAAPWELNLYVSPGAIPVKLVNEANAVVQAIFIKNDGTSRTTGLGFTAEIDVPGYYKIIKGQNLADWTIMTLKVH